MECVAAWTSRTDGTAWRNLIQLRTNTTTQALYAETYNGYVYGVYHKDGQGDTYTSQTFRPELNRPYHIMFVLDSSLAGAQSTKIYIDGILYNTAQQVQATGSVSSLNNLILGGQSVFNGRSTQFYIRDVKISNIARDATYALSSAKALLSL